MMVCYQNREMNGKKSCGVGEKEKVEQNISNECSDLSIPLFILFLLDNSISNI